MGSSSPLFYSPQKLPCENVSSATSKVLTTGLKRCVLDQLIELDFNSLILLIIEFKFCATSYVLFLQSEFDVLVLNIEIELDLHTLLK